MSEPSFNCLALWALYAFIWGFGESPEDRRRWMGAIWFTIFLTAALHHRPHAVAIAGAVAITAFSRDRFRAWPWFVACAVAGTLRLPLYLHWGGLVTSQYQDLFGFGVRLDGLTYLLVAILPWTAAWTIAPLFDPSARRRSATILSMAAVSGIMLAIVAMPNVDAKVTYSLPGETEIRSQAEFAGAMTTAIRTLLPGGFVRQMALAAFAGLGAASMAGLAISAFRIGRARAAADETSAKPRSVAMRLAWWMLACGMPLYIITAGPVYDRYLMVWTVLMPIAWLISLPRILWIAQAIVHAGMVGSLAHDWLMRLRL